MAARPPRPPKYAAMRWHIEIGRLISVTRSRSRVTAEPRAQVARPRGRGRLAPASAGGVK